MTEAESNARFPTRFERTILTKGAAWIDAILAPAPAEEMRVHDAAPAADPRLILLCMTPRSGSTALSAVLDSTKRLGKGNGERLNRKNKALRMIASETHPRSRRELLERVIDASRTRNGVAQIKCDLPQLLPFLLDPGCYEILRQAHFVYLTRGDILGQAISRYRSIATGVAHLRVKGVVEGDDDYEEYEDEEKEVMTKREVPYSFSGILAQVDRLTNMMAAYEKIFAMLAIQPLRISYEQLTAAPGPVVRDIARLVGVGFKATSISSLDAGGHKKVSGSNNDTLREQFLRDANTAAIVAG